MKPSLFQQSTLAVASQGKNVTMHSARTRRMDCHLRIGHYRDSREAQLLLHRPQIHFFIGPNRYSLRFV